jgi:hypothetical protein
VNPAAEGHLGTGESTPLFRWDGAYWGFVVNDRVYDRHGRQFAWLEAVAGHVTDAFDLSGRFVGERRDRYHILRNVLRPEPVHRAERAPIPAPSIPAAAPDHDPRDPLDGWADALPWPLPPPPPPVY